MLQQFRILIVEDNDADADMLGRELKRVSLPTEVRRAHGRESFALEFARQPDLILTDFSMPGFGAIELLRHVRAAHSDTPVIIISGTIGEDAAVEAMKHGAVDYLLKDRLTRLGPAIERVVEYRRLHRQRRESEALLRLAGRMGRIGAWAVDLGTKEITWSDEVRRLHEVPVDYVPTLAEAIDFYAPEFRPTIQAAVLSCMQSGTPFDLELQLITSRGRHFWVRAIGEAERDDRGNISRIQGALQDISERKAAAEHMAQLAERLITTFESITDAFFTVDLEWRFTYVNQEAERLLRRSRAELLGKILWSEFPEARGSTFEREYQRAMRENLSVSFEERYSPLEMWAEVHAYPSKQGLAVYFRDVTERRRLEEERAAALVRERAARQEADAARSHFRTLFEYIPGLFLVLAPEDYRIVAVSEAYLQATMTTREGIIGRSLFEVFPDDPDDADADGTRNLRASLERVAHTGAADAMALQRYPVRRSPAQGGGFEERYWSPFNSPVFGANGELAYIIHRVEDVTDFVRLKQREGTWEQGQRSLASRLERMDMDLVLRAQEVLKLNDKLQASEAHYRLLFRRNPHPMWVFDLETKKFLAVNLAAQEKYGYTEAEFLTMFIEDIRPAEDLSRLRASMEAVPVQKNVEVWRHRTKSGGTIDVEVTADTIEFNKRPARLILANDITERLRAESRIARQAALIDQANDAIIVRDLNQVIQFWSKGAERLYGWTADEAVGRLENELVGQRVERFSEAVQHVLSAGDWSGELEQTTKNGNRIVVSAHWSLVRTPSGQPSAILAIKSDITERKKIEAQFLRAQRLESIGTLAGGIAHDLNNLLAPIIMGVGLLKLSPLSPRDQNVVSTIKLSAERGTNLVRQVLSFARGVEGSRVAVDVRHLIREVALIIADTFPKNIDLQTDVAKDPGLITGDPTQLNQVLLNLCVNARDAMSKGGRLVINVHTERLDDQYAATHRGVAPGEFVVIEVADTGAGIPKDLIDKIFEPFFTTKERGQGTGLGLSTTAGIVRSHGGFINVYSEVGNGTVFRVFLPAQRGGGSCPEGEPERPSAELPRGKGEWLLFVDDEANIRAITTQTLEAFGYRVIVAEDGAEAIGHFASNKDRIRAVITDLMMPVMDGHGLIAAIRRIAPSMPIIATSGLQANAEVAKASNAGVRHFIAKPFSAETLLKQVRAILDSGDRPDPARESEPKGQTAI